MCSKPLRSRPTVEAKLSTFKLVLCPMYWQHVESTEQFSKLSFIRLEHCLNNELSALKKKKKIVYIEFQQFELI